MAQYLNAADFISVDPVDPIGAAIKASNYGGKIYVPGREEKFGPWRPPTKEGWTIDKPIEIFGDGRVNEAVGLGYHVGVNSTADSVIFRLKQGANHFYLHDIALSGPTGYAQDSTDPRGFTIPKGTGCGIRYTEPGKVIGGVTLENVGIFYSGGDGIDCTPPDTDSTGYFVAPYFHNVKIYGCNGWGMRLRNATALSFRGVSMNQCRMGALWASSIDGMIDACVPEGNGYDLTDPFTQANVYIENSAGLTINARLEDYGHGLSKTGLILKNCEGVVVDGSMFQGAGGSGTGIYAENIKNCYFGQNTYYGMTTTLHIADDGKSKDCHIFDQRNFGWSYGTGQMIVPKSQKHFRYYATDSVPRQNQCVLPGPPQPSQPVSGQVFYDKSNRRVRLFDGSRWRTIGSY